MSSTVTASARLFTAANSEFLSATDAAWNSPTGSWYQAGWVKLTTNATQVVLLAKYGTANQNAFQAYYNNATSKFGLTQSSNGVLTVGVEFGSTSSTGTWYFVENYYDSTNQLCGININRGTDATVAQILGQHNSTDSIRWGAQNGAFYANAAGGPTVFLSGMPTAAERNSLYNSGNGVLYKDRPTFSTATILAWYDMVETSGQAYDANGSNHLTDNNTVTSAAGKVTYTAEDASQFTAANTEYLSITDASQSGLDIGNADKYFCAWVYLDNLGTLRQIVSKWLVNATTQQSYTFYISASNQLVWIVSKDGTTANNVSCTASEVVVASRWYFCEVWHNATSDLIGASLNRGTEATAAITTGVNDGTRDFTISMFSPDYPFNGRISSVVVTNGIPTATERDALYNRGFGVDYSDKPALSVATYVSWWELTEASGSRADSHGSNTLTDNNSVTGNPGVVYDVVTPPAGGGSYGSTLGLMGIIQ